MLDIIIASNTYIIHIKMKVKLLQVLCSLVLFRTTSLLPEFRGCYIDADDRTLPDKRLKADNMTTSMCLDFCSCKGYSFAGTEFYINCFCGNGELLTVTNEAPDPDECNTPCGGNITQICGGRWRLSVYFIDLSTVPSREKSCEEVPNTPQALPRKNVTQNSNIKTKLKSDEDCPCICSKPAEWFNVTRLSDKRKRLEEKLMGLRKILLLERKKMSSYKRTKTSAYDSRLSSTGIGIVSVIVIVCVITSVVIMDVGRFIVHCRK